jgi:hypothetical protein
MDAMVARTPAALPWAQPNRLSENGVSLDVGDGLWGTISGHGQPVLEAADPTTGQAAWFGVVQEHGQPAFLVLRLKAEGGRIAEVEMVVRRKGGPPQYSDPDQWARDPAFAETAKGGSSSRQLAATVKAYFASLAGASHASVRFAPGCTRLDNGLPTTGGAAAEGGVEGCAAQLKAGVFRPIGRVRALALPVIDTAHGVVIATGFLDLPARSPKPEAHALSFAANYPYSVAFAAAFKLERGAIARIQTVQVASPYLMASPWTPDAAKP